MTTQDYTKQDNTRDTAQTQEGDIKVLLQLSVRDLHNIGYEERFNLKYRRRNGMH